MMVMKKIKVFLLFLFCLMFAVGLNLLANDWEFGSQGGHIVLMNMSDIAIKSEKLYFKLEKGERKDVLGHEMLATVKFVFDSPEAGERYIGFITPEGGSEGWDKTDHFKNFRTVVNGKDVDTVSYRLTDLIPKDVKQLEEVKKHYADASKKEYLIDDMKEQKLYAQLFEQVKITKGDKTTFADLFKK